MFVGRQQRHSAPVEKESLKLIKFSKVAEKYVEMQGFKPYQCSSEKEARSRAAELIMKAFGHVIFSNLIHLEKSHMKNFILNDNINFCKFKNIGIVEMNYKGDNLLKHFNKN